MKNMIRNKIIECRKIKGWTKAELSRRTNISQQLLCDIEHGRRNVSTENLFILAKVLEFSIDQIYSS